MAEELKEPDFTSYHKSLTHELHSVKDRIRNIIQNRHWLSDGEFKEAALRSVLRRHMPESLLIGRGFIVSPSQTSTQIDILVVDGSRPTLFKDGDLLIVTPDAVRAVIEVKTTLRQPNMIKTAVKKLAAIGRLCSDITEQPDAIWTGLFVYDAEEPQHDALLRAAGNAVTTQRHAINCIANGRNAFMRYWSASEIERGDVTAPMNGPFWRSYELSDLSPAYFIGNALQAVAPDAAGTGTYAWFPLITGKTGYGRRQLQRGSVEPEPVRCE